MASIGQLNPSTGDQVMAVSDTMLRWRMAAENWFRPVVLDDVAPNFVLIALLPELEAMDKD